MPVKKDVKKYLYHLDMIFFCLALTYNKLCPEILIFSVMGGNIYI
jgi:hypothetical protein